MTDTEPSDPKPIGGASPLSLFRRVVSGGAVMMGGYTVGQALRLVSNLILARLVVPEAFGLMAVAISIHVWVTMMTDIGINASIVRSRNAENSDYLRTAWTVQIVRNFAVWLFTAIAAAVVFHLSNSGAVQTGSIFANPLLPWVIVAAGLQILISGFISTNKFIAERRLAMGRLVAVEISAQLIAMVVTIYLAYLGYGVWALVIGGNIGAIANVAASHMFFPGPRMAFRFHRAHFDELFHFGKWLILASSFGFIVNRGDQLLFGWLMESDRFSLYAVATLWITAAITVFSTVISRIFYPAFSEILRDRPEGLGAAYKRVRLLADISAVAAAFGAFFLAEIVFGLLYPENYDGIGYFIKLMTPVLLFVPYHLISAAALASGDSRGFTAVTAITGIAILILLPSTFNFFGEKVAVIAFAAASVISLPVVWRLGAKFMKIDPLVEIRMLVAAALLIAMILR